MKIIFLFLFSFINTTVFSQWSNTNSPHFSEVAVTGNFLFGADASAGVYISTNNGTNWSLTSLNIPGINKIAANGTNIFAGTVQQDNRGIFRSTNNGLKWTKILSPDELYRITTIEINGNEIYTSTGWKIYRSTNNGINWVQTSTNFFVNSLTVNGSYLFAGAEATGVYISTSNGANWTQTSLNNRNTWSVKINGANIFAGTEAGVYLSTNNGANWALTSLDKNRYVSSLYINGTDVFAATDEGVFLSKNNGTNWIQKNEGLSGGVLENPFITGSANYIYLANESSSMWKRELSEIISIRNLSSEVPQEFHLYQNYPNPFNPSTKILFSVPHNSFVSLKVFNVLGKEISVLLSQNLNSGVYEYYFNGDILPSGIYFYRLETEKHSAAKSMVLIK